MPTLTPDSEQMRIMRKTGESQTTNDSEKATTAMTIAGKHESTLTGRKTEVSNEKVKEAATRHEAEGLQLSWRVPVCLAKAACLQRKLDVFEHIQQIPHVMHSERLGLLAVPKIDRAEN